MISPFEYTETLSADTFNQHTECLSIAINPTPKVILLRGLVGSLRLKHTFSLVEFEQSTDYFDLANVNGGQSPIEKLKNYLAQEFTEEDLGRIFKDQKFLHQNHSFFLNLTNEFSNFYYYENKNSHTTAFAYLYRILEKISYAFPFIYATKTNDFIGTYDYLKGFLTGAKDKGELGFFKGFIKEIFKNEPEADPDFSIAIDITVPHEEVEEREKFQRSLFNSFRKACPDVNVYAASTDEPRRLSIKFSEYSSFIICIRNRFFHLLNSGHPNLQSDDIIDADYFFKLINRQTAYWISLVLLEILKHNIARTDEPETTTPNEVPA